MRAVTRVALAELCSGLSAAPASLGGQGQWVPPQPPCDLPAGHFKVTGGVLYLKNAAEKPNQRDQQLAQARKVLTEAIAQDHQEKNPAAWYYLGRYYFEVSDARGTDTAFARALALQPKCADDIRGYRSQVWAKTVNGGLAAWQEGKEDSAVVLFHLAARLEPGGEVRSEEHTSELQSRPHLVCRLLPAKKKNQPPRINSSKSSMRQRRATRCLTD